MAAPTAVLGVPIGATRGAESRSGAWKVVQALECPVAAAALALLAPVLAMVAAAIFLLSRRSPFVAHRRVGQYGQPLWTLKFRTMWPRGTACSTTPRWIEYIVDETGPREKGSRDPRVTHWFARLCRRFSVDELPQLIHIVSGKMSFVGPRPLTQTELLVHYGERSVEVLQVKPGITGLWQVKGRNRLTYRQRVRFDLFYVRAASTALYLHVLLRTIPCVLTGRDSW